jgi:hypothetical protein
VPAEIALCVFTQSLPQASERSHPELLDAVDRAAHLLGHFGERKVFQMTQHDDLAVVLRKRLEGGSQHDRRLTFYSRFARRGNGRCELMVEHKRGVVQLYGERLLQTCVALFRAEKSADVIGNQSGENATEPSGKFRFGRAAKLLEMPVGFEQGFLHQIGRVGFALQARANLRASQKHQVAAIDRKQFAERPGIASGGLVEQFVSASARKAVMHKVASISVPERPRWSDFTQCEAAFHFIPANLKNA